MFRFELGEKAVITCSEERGEIIARAEYANGAQDQYLLRYQCGDGRAVENWWEDGALSEV